MKHFILGMVTFSLMMGGIGNVTAGPVFVSYTASGSAGNWDLDFSVTNNMIGLPSQDIYLFGVLLSARDIIGSPTLYDPNGHTSFNTVLYGGTNTNYNNIWTDYFYTDPTLNELTPGITLSGFKVHDSDLAAPTSVSWFAFSVSIDKTDLYYGTDNFQKGDYYNPGFQNVANGPSAAAAVPEPSSLAMFSILLGLFAATRLMLRLHRMKALA